MDRLAGIFIILFTLTLPMMATCAPRYTNQITPQRMLIVLSAPSVDDPYYKDSFSKIIDFDVRFARAIMGHDNVVVLADKKTLPYLEGKLPDDILLEANIDDIWIRDFGTVLPNKMVAFVYDRPKEKSIQQSFARFARELGLKFSHSKLKVDGGNVVDSSDGTVILTDKVFERNPGLTEKELTRKLKGALGAKQIAYIPMDEEFLGHADGMVMFSNPHQLLVNNYPDDPEFKQEVLSALKHYLPGIKITEIEGAGYGEQYGDYASACGIYVNSVVTHNYIYAPRFGNSKDHQALQTIQDSSDKKLISVDAQNVCYLGGNLRCLSWQLTGENANKLIQAAREPHREAQ
ncbi:agmatine deiminase family protein [Dongshaea marina]|uniref:agmatine deiminase family protein n=1 Tax=Dongshaea marina TaxID=2047966 RepID=UPI000D3EA59B|nr:agmatine deiminase family protein [Dongshaea marina]